jgi:Helix-turn-helix domain
MRGLATIPTRTDNSLRSEGYRLGTSVRHGGMRTDRRSRPAAAHGAHAGRPVRAVEPQPDHAPSFTRSDLLTANDVADILQIKRTTALDYMRRGVIPASKIGRRWYALRSRLDVYLADLFEADLRR